MKICQRETFEGHSIKLAKLIAKTGLISSGSEARRLIIQGGIEVDGIKETNPDKLIAFEVNQQRRLKIGKKKFAIAELKPDTLKCSVKIQPLS